MAGEYRISMSNVLYEELPTIWNGYKVNTWFQIGVQLVLLIEDETIDKRIKPQIMISLLFGNEDGSIRETPETDEEIRSCVEWFLNGWNYDKTADQESNEKIMDFYVDQGRIYADFRQIYHINLNSAQMHWWEFCWLLWNMPRELSSFMQVLEIRTKKPGRKASAEERRQIQKGKQIYGLGEPRREKTYSGSEIAKIDSYDERMRKIRSSQNNGG